MNIESSTLVLRTINATNNTNRTTSTWRVNLRQTLGNLYNNYRRFKICLTSWGTAAAVNGFVADVRVSRLCNVPIVQTYPSELFAISFTNNVFS